MTERYRKRLLWSRRTAALAFGLAIGVGFSATQALAADDPIRIGVILPLSGPAARIGKENQEGILLAFEQAGYKVGGRKIELVTADDQHNPNVGLAEARRLIENSKVVAIIGTLNSAVALATHAYTTRSKIPYVTGGIASSITGSRKSAYTFRSSFSSGQMEGALAEFLVRKGFKSAILMGSDYAAGRDAVRSLGTHLKSLGGTIVTELFPRAGETDYAPFFSRIAGKKADFVFGYFFGGDTLRFVRAYRSFGLKYPLVITTSAVSAASVASALGKNVDGVMSAELWVPSLTDADTKAFVDAYTKRFGHPPQSLSYDGYIKGRVIIEGLKKLDGKVTDGAALAKAIKSVSFAAPGGTFKFDDSNNPIVSAYFVEWRIQDGKPVAKILEKLTGISQAYVPKK